MAARKEKSKEAKIKSEKTRLKGIFKDLDENKKKLVTPLIEKAAFMSIELDELQNVIEETGWTSEYKNGENQYGTKKPGSRNIHSIIKELCGYHQAINRACACGKTQAKQAGSP